MSCFIQRVNGAMNGWATVRRTRNLGWILRHWQDALRITVEPRVDGGAWVFWYLRDGRRFVSEYADRGVLRGFLDRPVFRGLIVTWDSRLYTIGDEQYRAMREAYEKECAW